MSVSLSPHRAPHLPYWIHQIISSEGPSWNQQTYISHLNKCAREDPNRDLEFDEDHIATQGTNENYPVNSLGTPD